MNQTNLKNYLSGMYQGIKFAIKVVGNIKRRKAIIFFLCQCLADAEHKKFESIENVWLYCHRKLKEIS